VLNPGADITINRAGRLVLPTPWPGLASRLVDAELALDNGVYDTGDLAREAPDGGIIIQGRSELAGADLPLAAAEAAAASHPDVAEAAAVAAGHAITVYVTLRAEAAEGRDMAQTLLLAVRAAIPGPEFPLEVRVAAELPKTRSGKIARQALRQAAEGSLGDTSGLADPSVMNALMDNRSSLF